MTRRPDRDDATTVRDASWAVHGGNRPDRTTGAIRTPIITSNSYRLPRDPDDIDATDPVLGTELLEPDWLSRDRSQGGAPGQRRHGGPASGWRVVPSETRFAGIVRRRGIARARFRSASGTRQTGLYDVLVLVVSEREWHRAAGILLRGSGRTTWMLSPFVRRGSGSRACLGRLSAGRTTASCSSITTPRPDHTRSLSDVIKMWSHASKRSGRLLA